MAVTTSATWATGTEAESGTKGGAEAPAWAEAERVAAPGVMPQVLTHLIAHIPVGVPMPMGVCPEAETGGAVFWVEWDLHR